MIKVFWPFGALKANWSKVMTSPPAFKILALAPAVNLKAATVAFGNSNNLLSSVTVPTTTMVLSAAPFWPKARAILETETGGLLTLDKYKDFKITLLNGASVLPIEYELVWCFTLLKDRTFHIKYNKMHSQNEKSSTQYNVRSKSLAKVWADYERVSKTVQKFTFCICSFILTTNILHLQLFFCRAYTAEQRKQNFQTNHPKQKQKACLTCILFAHWVFSSFASSLSFVFVVLW